MPDFAMPSEEDLAAERRAEAIAHARAADPASALRDRLGLEQEPIDETALADAGRLEQHDGDDEPIAQAAPILPPPDAATRIHSRRADRPVRVPSAVRRRALAIVRNPVVAFATGAAVVAAGFLAAPAITAWTERGTLAELERVVEEYEAAINAGDVEAVLALHRPDEQTASMALLDAGVAPTTLPLVSCESPEPGREVDVATARCTMSVETYGSSGQPLPVRLERTDGAWRVVSGLEQPAYIAPMLFEVVSLAGVPMAGLLDDDLGQYWLLPGGYESETRTTDLIALTDYGGLLVGDSGGFLNVSAQAADVVVAEVEAAALDYAESCVVDAESAAACGIVPPPAGRELTATISGMGGAQDELTLTMPVRIGGSGEIAAPNVEVLVRFDETWSSYELEVTGVTEMYG